MIRIELRFPAGRYHATPWSSHVNEGEIEWPPSPWRIARALVSVGFSKLGWSEVPEDAARVVEALASTVPSYGLPPVASGHLRHYMPDKAGSSVKVLDAFAYPGRGAGAVLRVAWPHEASARELEVLHALVAGLGYLGRAESWIDARLVGDDEELEELGLDACAVGETAPGPGYERVPLLGLLPADEFVRWREAAVDRAVSERLAGLQASARAKGKAEPSALSKGDGAKVRAFYPERAFDVLLRDTEELHKAGWREPPATRWLSYWRRADALVPRAAARRAAPRVKPPTMAVLALASDTEHGGALPSLCDALPRCGHVHAAWVKRLENPGAPGAWVVTGKMDHERVRNNHGHAALHPFARLGGGPGGERVGRFDHLLVSARAGLDADAVAALGRVRQLGWSRSDKALGDERASQDKEIALFVSLVGLGQREDLERLVPMLRAARQWESVTPFVPMRHLKAQPSGSLSRIVQDELHNWGQPRAERIEVQVERFAPAGLDWEDVERFWGLWQLQRGQAAPEAEDLGRLASHWRHFWTTRRNPSKPQPPHPGAFGLRLTFTEPVAGPIALGYGAHFGLGLFVPSAAAGLGA